VQIPAGLLADRMNRKGLLIAGFLLFGLAQGVFYPVFFSIASAVLPPGRRALGSAIIFSGLAIGNSLGYIPGSLAAPYLTGYLTHVSGTMGPALVLAGAVLGLAVAVLGLRRHHFQQDSR
jgi:predicted MFS family arabinose efflux permease